MFRNFSVFTPKVAVFTSLKVFHNHSIKFKYISSSDAHEPNLPRAESVRAYLVKARAQARALLIIIIIQVYCPYRI
jgi:hypothetical protein